MENKTSNTQQFLQTSLNKTQISVKKVCTRCHGSGRLPQFKHIENGICFKCRGVR